MVNSDVTALTNVTALMMLGTTGQQLLSHHLGTRAPLSPSRDHNSFLTILGPQLFSHHLGAQPVLLFIVKRDYDETNVAADIFPRYTDIFYKINLLY